MNDVELGPEEKSLIAAAREANAPTEVQRTRVSQGLEVKLAAGAVVPLLTGTTAMAMVGKIGAGVALLAAVATGATYVVVTQPARTRLQPAVVAEPPSSPPVAMPPSVVAPEPEPSLAPAPSPAVSDAPQRSARAKAPRQRPVAKPAPSVDLAGELALLTQANAAIKRGDVAQARELLDGYDQRFPSGKLAEERAAAGILVLCATGRAQSAGVEARRFIERWPRSPLVARIRASCAAEGLAP